MTERTGTPLGRSAVLAVLTASVVSLACLDLLISLLRYPPDEMAAAKLVELVGLSVGVFAASLAPTCLIVAGLLMRWRPLQPFACIFSLITFVGTLVLLTNVSSAPELGYGTYLRVHSSQFAANILAATVVGLYFYMILSPPRANERRADRLITIALALPLILAVSLALWWVVRFWAGSLFSTKGLVLAVAYGAWLLLVVAGVRRVALRSVVTSANFLLAMILLVTPFVTQFLSPSARSNSSAFVQNDLPVKRIILLTVDTLRANALSCYGNRRISTPNIDRLAREGVRFTEALSPAPWTLAAFASLMTGLSPSVHGATRPDSVLPTRIQTLAEVLRSAGYHTGAIGRNKFLARPFQMAQGFVDYEFFPKYRCRSVGNNIACRFIPGLRDTEGTSEQLTDRAIRWLGANQSRDFFLWLHYFDPHMPYEPREKYLPEAGSAGRVGNSLPGSTLASARMGTFVPTPAERARIESLYLAEVRDVDANIGRFLEAMERMNLTDDALIIFTSDHGEEFWEHGGFEHGHTLYRELLRVPLVLTGFSIEPKVISHNVSTESVLPTLLELCGITYDPEILTGRSLMPLITEAVSVADPSVIISTGLLYHEDRISIRFEDFAYIKNLVRDAEELYDLSSDSSEQHNIAAARPEVLGRAREILAQHETRTNRLRTQFDLSGKERRELDPETLRQLKSLGYVGEDD